MGDTRILKTLDRSLFILTLFDAQHPSWGVSELARHLDLPKSVVQKTLATFARRGFLYQEKMSRRYRLGPRILSLARSAEPELARMAQPHMASLAEATRETAKLTMLDGAETVIVAAVESPQSLRMTGRVGERNALYAGASNKLLAAYLPWSEVETAVLVQRPSGDGPEDWLRRLHDDLQNIKAAGYAMSSGEIEHAVQAVAVPVFGYEGEVMAGLSIVGPSVRMDETRRSTFLQLLRETSATISQSLGCPETT